MDIFSLTVHVFSLTLGVFVLNVGVSFFAGPQPAGPNHQKEPQVIIYTRQAVRSTWQMAQQLPRVKQAVERRDIGFQGSAISGPGHMSRRKASL